MKSNRSLSELAARALSEDANLVRPVPDEARASAIAAMTAAMRAKRGRRRWQRGVAAATAIAAAIALAVAFGRGRDSSAPIAEVAPKVVPAASAMFVRGTSAVVRHGNRTPLEHGASLEAGDRVVVESGARTTLALPNGTSLVAADGAELVLVSAAPQMVFELGAGSVHADVAKLRPGERFVIRTGDAEVEVHGTSFDVVRVPADPRCGHGATTRVKVTEGIVAVRAAGNETFVRPRETWPADCELAPAPPSAVEDAPVSSATRAPVKRPDAPVSTLAAQNDLFEKAMTRKRAGDANGALEAFDELLTRYPSSHLAQSAMGERLKLLRGVDKVRAKKAARDYLERYPNGFARRDAELVLSGD